MVIVAIRYSQRTCQGIAGQEVQTHWSSTPGARSLGTQNASLRSLLQHFQEEEHFPRNERTRGQATTPKLPITISVLEQSPTL